MAKPGPGKNIKPAKRKKIQAAKAKNRAAKEKYASRKDKYVTGLLLGGPNSTFNNGWSAGTATYKSQAAKDRWTGNPGAIIDERWKISQAGYKYYQGQGGTYTYDQWAASQQEKIDYVKSTPQYIAAQAAYDAYQKSGNPHDYYKAAGITDPDPNSTRPAVNEVAGPKTRTKSAPVRKGRTERKKGRADRGRRRNARRSE